MKKILRVWVAYLSISLQRFSMYRGDVVFRLIGMLPVFMVMVFLFALPFRSVESLAGWSMPQVLAVLGTFYMAEGAAWALFKGGIFQMEKYVGSGSMDGLLLKPVSSVFLLSFLEMDLSRLVDVLIGGVLVVTVVVRYEVEVSIFMVAGFMVSFAAGLVISFCIYLIVNTVSFWTTEAYLGHVANPVFAVARYPVEVWGRDIGTILYWVIPLGVLSTVPVGVLFGKLDLVWVGSAVGLAFVWIVGARVFWRFALRGYAGVGS